LYSIDFTTTSQECRKMYEQCVFKIKENKKHPKNALKNTCFLQNDILGISQECREKVCLFSIYLQPHPKNAEKCIHNVCLK
jgi:hypothetical protein